MQAFAGICAAAVTPRNRKGDLDFGAALELLDHLARGKVDGVALLTAAGEYPAFSLDDRIRLLYLSCKRSRLPVWAGVGSASLEDSVRLAREARSAGAEAVLLPPPLFLPCSQEVLREYYLEFAAQMEGGPDIFVCDTPLAASALDLETVRCLLRHPEIGGIADSGCDASLLRGLEHRRATPPLSLLVSCDRMLGGFQDSGAISACACALPELAAAVHRGAGGALREAFFEFVEWAERLPPTVAVKVATGLRGLEMGPCAVPLPARVRHEVESFRDWFRLWLPPALGLVANA